jgi:hypothetical protein
MIVDEGLITLLDNFLLGFTTTARIRLFANNVTVDASTVIGDLTEATFPGYAYILTTAVGFPTPTINGSDQAETDGPTMTWTCTSTPGSPETVYGLYVTSTDSFSNPKLIFAVNFAVPQTITTTGDAVEKVMNWYTQDLEP